MDIISPVPIHTHTHSHIPREMDIIPPVPNLYNRSILTQGAFCPLVTSGPFWPRTNCYHLQSNGFYNFSRTNDSDVANLPPFLSHFSRLSPQTSASCAIPASCNGNLNHIHKRVSWAVPTGLLLETCSSLHSQGMVSGNAVYCRRHPWQGAT